MANKKVIYYIQTLLSRWLSYPVIPEGKTTGHALVRSERNHCTLGANIRIEDPYVLHNVTLGDYSYISRNSLVANTTIGRFCSVGPNLVCGQGLHPTSGVSTHPMFYSPNNPNDRVLASRPLFEEHRPVSIGHDVYIGANVFILDGVTIGHGAVVGAGAVVTKDVPPYAVAAGVPAKVVKYRFDADTVRALLERRWWDDPEEELHKVADHFWDVEAFLANK